MLGWTAQLAIGVAFWILPRFQTQRGNVRLVWTAFALLNIGIWVAVLPPLASNQYAARLAGRAAESAAFLAFLVHAWPRVKAPGVRHEVRPDTDA